MYYQKIITFIFLATFAISARSQITIDQIMKGEDFTGYWPEKVFWSEDGKYVYFNWNPEMNSESSLYKISIAGNTAEKVSISELKKLPAKKGNYTFDRARKVYEKEGDIFLMDIRLNQITRITNTVSAETAPVFTLDGKDIVYRSGINLYSWSVETGIIIQLTNFQPGKPSGEITLPARQEWLRSEELSLISVLRKRDGMRIDMKAKSDSLKTSRPKVIFLEGRDIENINISPDEHYVTFTLARRPPDENTTHVPDYVTESSYSEMISSRANVGRPDEHIEFGIYDRIRDTVYYPDPKLIPGICDKPEFLKDYTPKDSVFNPEFNMPREVDVTGPVYNNDGSGAVVVILSKDNKDRWIMQLDLQDGKYNLLDRQRDEAWIGGPGINGWDPGTGNIGWLPDNHTLWYQSEASGYSQLYTVNVLTGKKKEITSGNFEIFKVQLSRSGKLFYIQAGAENPFEYHFYSIPVSGGKLEKITSLSGRNEVSISPDEKTLAVLYSYSNKIPELYLMPNHPGAGMLKITSSATTAFNSYPWRDPEIIQFEAKDGATVYARLYKPSGSPVSGAGIIFVHGAGYLHNVHKWWSEYYREYMFNNFLCDHGYTVLDIDYRGSAGYGRDWRTGIYRHMGGKDLTDQVDGAAYMIRSLKVDPGRIGIFGGSYGGFITLMAMFKYPETFKCGAALRSVTDWAHYNHGYTSAILNTPLEDSLAYQRSSPIYFAEGLKGELLMLHGVVDTNVHFQDVVRLTQRLIELGKTNWNLAIFPMENHGFVETSSWTDEYKRIFDLFERNLK
jgi:dipeptidyl aminopeptidase/acylaminoacyl peptidase